MWSIAIAATLTVAVPVLFARDWKDIVLAWSSSGRTIRTLMVVEGVALAVAFGLLAFGVLWTFGLYLEPRP